MEGCREKGGREEGATSVQAGAVGLQQSSGRGGEERRSQMK